MIVSANNSILSFFKNLVSSNKKTTAASNFTKTFLAHIEKPSLEFSPATDVFQKQGYPAIIANTRNNLKKVQIANKVLYGNPINATTYETLTPQQIDAVRAQLDIYIVNDAKHLVEVGKIVKQIFDKNYGEGQYTFVSIGRSLSALAKCMGHLGVETKHIPLSGCGGYKKPNETVDKMLRQDGFKNYKEFLEISLPKDNDKMYIFGDFSDIGTTLKTFKTLLNHPNVNLGRQNDKYIALNEVLNDYAKYEPKTKTLVTRFNEDLYWQNFDNYSEVRSLNYKELNKLPLSLKPTANKLNKLLNFCIIDMLKTSEK